jgi:hypothetical protein
MTPMPPITPIPRHPAARSDKQRRRALAGHGWSGSTGFGGTVAVPVACGLCGRTYRAGTPGLEPITIGLCAACSESQPSH